MCCGAGDFCFGSITGSTGETILAHEPIKRAVLKSEQRHGFQLQPTIAGCNFLVDSKDSVPAALATLLRWSGFTSHSLEWFAQPWISIVELNVQDQNTLLYDIFFYFWHAMQFIKLIKLYISKSPFEWIVTVTEDVMRILTGKIFQILKILQKF